MKFTRSCMQFQKSAIGKAQPKIFNEFKKYCTEEFKGSVNEVGIKLFAKIVRANIIADMINTFITVFILGYYRSLTAGCKLWQQRLLRTL